VTPSLPLVGQDFAGYRLRGVLGRGGMSVVYEAENVRLGNTIALKVLAPELSTDDAFRARFLKESRLAASLNHPNVIPIYDSGPSDELLYIAMRYVAGSDLRSVLDTRGHISPDQALPLIGQAGRALDAAHRLGLIHRDVKPANLLIEGGADEEDPDHVYLSDFGITKHTLSRSGLTATGQLVGTIDYIAPEQIQDKDVDGRADIYSLGCVLYECLTGQVPFVKDLDAAVIWAHVEEPPAPPSDIRSELPSAIDGVIMCALAKDPDDRYQTCREFVAAAHAALEPAPQASGSPASEVDIAAGPPTVLSGQSIQESTPLHPNAADATSAAAAMSSASAATTPAPAAETSAPADTSPPPAAVGSDHELGSHEPALAAHTADAATPAGDTAGSPPLAADTTDSPRPVAEQPPAPPAPPAKPDRADPAAKTGRRAWYAAALVALLAGAAVAVVLLTSSSSTTKGEPSSAALGQVPTNHVTGSGSATVRLNGNAATVTVTTTGLDNDDALVHAMHIHAGGKGVCPPASAARLHNGHLTISTTDGINYYGPPVVALTTRGDTSPASILTFPRYLTGGNLHYSRTITVSPSVAAHIRQNNAVVVVHGIDYDNTGIYSGVLERSELNNSLPATATAPALCGPLRGPAQAATVNPGTRGRALTYTASLDVNPAAGVLDELFYCQAGEAILPVGAGDSARRASAAGAA
jgi:serine/threonine protein kinase